MRKDKFMDLLDKEEYSYFEQGGKIIIDEPSLFDLDIPSIPSGVVFRNGGDVYLDYVTFIPKGTEFENDGHVFVQGAISLSEGIKFRNRGDVNMESIRSFDVDIIFKNSGDLKFDLLNNINRPIIFQNRESIFFSSGSLPNFTKGVRFQNGKEIVVYDENVKNFFIPGIKDNRVLNCMIKQIYG
jgi:hypothetical protein